MDQEVELEHELAGLQREEVIPGSSASQIAVFESQKEYDWSEETNEHGHLESVEKNRDSLVLNFYEIVDPSESIIFDHVFNAQISFKISVSKYLSYLLYG